MPSTPERLRALIIASLPVLALGCAGTAARSAQVPAASPAVSRTLLEERDLPDLPGWQTRLYLIEYGPGVIAPLHHHPREGLGYVVSGSFESAFDGGRPVIVREGQSFVDRSVVPHTLFRNLDATRPLKFVIAYTIRKGEPFVEAP